MKGSPYNSHQAAKQKKRLARLLLGFGVLLAVPLAVLFWSVYWQLESQAFFRLRAAAEEVTNRINEQLYQIIKPEEDRPFDQYNFFSVFQNAIIGDQSNLNISPLASLPVQTGVPGVLGYFQVEPDGTFRSPSLPELKLGVTTPAKTAAEDDLKRRQELNSQLAKLVVPNLFGTNRSRSSSSQEGEGSGIKRSEQRLDQLKLDQKWSESQRGQKSKYSRGENESKVISQVSRKEKLNVLEDARVPVANAPAPNYEKKAGNSAKDKAEKQEAFSAVAKVQTFEGEIDPFQFKLLPATHYGFFRRVWREGQRYTQGFVVDGKGFNEQLFRSNYGGSSLSGVSSLVLAYQGRILERFGAPPSDSQEILIYRSVLNSPLDGFELVFTAPSLPLGPAKYIVGTSVFAVIVFLPLGLLFLYWLGSAQIELVSRQSDFVSAVSHELKTPLTSIRMYGEILRAGWVEDEAKKRSYYDFIFSESERLSRLISNVLLHARLSREDVQLELKIAQPGHLLDVVRSKVSTVVEAAGFQLELEPTVQNSALQVMVDEDEFLRIFINLCENSLKFSKSAEKKMIIIGYREAGDQIEFFVRDFGPGIAKTDQRKIFELFYRAEDEMTRKTPGTGIGLSLVKELARKMNAQVDFHNCLPGVEFTLRFLTCVSA